MHLGHKAIALSGDGGDIQVLFRRFTQGFSQRGNTLGQIDLFHEAVGPERFHQFLFGHHPVVVAHQDKQRFKGLGSEGQGLIAAAYQAARGVQAERAEVV